VKLQSRGVREMVCSVEGDIGGDLRYKAEEPDHRSFG